MTEHQLEMFPPEPETRSAEDLSGLMVKALDRVWDGAHAALELETERGTLRMELCRGIGSQLYRWSRANKGPTICLDSLARDCHVHDASVLVEGMRYPFHAVVIMALDELRRTGEIDNTTFSRHLPNKARCLSCDDVVHSRHRHDFVTCSCGAFSLDGGDAYWRVIGDFSKIQRLDWDDTPIDNQEKA